MVNIRSKILLGLSLLMQNPFVLGQSIETSKFNIGITSPLNKVFQNPPYEFNGRLNEPAHIELARNEYEATQLVIFPKQQIPELKILVTDLVQQNNAARISQSDIQINIVGYINLITPEFQSSRTGYYPDPLLPNQVLQLQAKVPQPVLITVRSHKNTLSGTYHGQIKILSQNAIIKTVPLEVVIWNIEIPYSSQFKTFSMPQKESMQTLWPKNQGYHKPDHHEIEKRYHHLAELGFRNRLPPTAYLANGLISYNWKGKGETVPGYNMYDWISENSYRFNQKNFVQQIEYLKQHNSNSFLIAVTGDIYLFPELAEQRKNTLLSYLSYVIPVLKQQNILDKSYIYNIDEPWGKSVDHAKNIYKLIKSQFGNDVKIIQNTNQNNGYILKELRGNFDVLDINLGFYHITKLEKYRKKYPNDFPEVFWNLNLWPRTRPNLFVEYPLIDARIIGPMSFRFNLQGFEYWNLVSLTGVQNYKPLKSTDIQLTWNVQKNSLDGLLAYPSENFDFYSSLRFESFRDGMEDLELLYILEKLDSGNPLLAVPIIHDISDYSQIDVEFFNFRRRVANEILRLQVSKKSLH